MAHSSEVLYCYSRLAEYVAHMATLAAAKDWTTLPRLQDDCLLILERLQRLPAPETLPPQLRDEARYLIQRIRADQEAVIGLLRPQLQALLSTMGKLNAQKSLSNAYGDRH